MPEPRPLTYDETTRLILSKLGDLENPVVLIGGQAVGFWASLYQERVHFLSNPPAELDPLRRWSSHAAGTRR